MLLRTRYLNGLSGTMEQQSLQKGWKISYLMEARIPWKIAIMIVKG